MTNNMKHEYIKKKFHFLKFNINFLSDICLISNPNISSLNNTFYTVNLEIKLFDH